MSSPELQITQAHFQLTGQCNLHCVFCGQAKGMLTEEASRQQNLMLDDWLRAADELAELAGGDTGKVSLMLWGGEPLLYPEFDQLARELSALGFRLGVVTNGTLIDQHFEVLNRCFERIHVSLDGTKELHDAVRGEGVFERVANALPLLRKRRGRLLFLTTISDANVAVLPQLPEKLALLEPDAITFQPLMYLRQAEIDQYRTYSQKHFGCDYPELQSWHREEDKGYLTALKNALELLQKHPESRVPWFFTPHCYPDLLREGAPYCTAAWKRIHIRHDGEVGFCTDYFGFSAGNVRQSAIQKIIVSPKAKAFRQAVMANALPICRHCPWHRQLASSSTCNHP